MTKRNPNRNPTRKETKHAAASDVLGPVFTDKSHNLYDRQVGAAECSTLEALERQDVTEKDYMHDNVTHM